MEEKNLKKNNKIGKKELKVKSFEQVDAFLAGWRLFVEFNSHWRRLQEICSPF
jgi:hypothetical protein